MRQLKITKSITNRESEALEKYLQEIGKEELLTTDEEVELAQLIRKGDRHALDKLTKANLRFVVSVAKQYQNQGLSLPVVSSLSHMPYGGFARAFCRLSLSRVASFACRSIRWVRSTRSTRYSPSLNRRTSAAPQ